MLSDLHAVGWMGNSTGLVYLFIVVVFLLLLLLSLSCTGPTQRSHQISQDTQGLGQCLSGRTSKECASTTMCYRLLVVQLRECVKQRSWQGRELCVALHTGQFWCLVELFSETPLTCASYGFHRTCLSTRLHIHGLNTAHCCSSLLRNGSILLQRGLYFKAKPSMQVLKHCKDIKIAGTAVVALVFELLSRSNLF